MKRQKPKHPVLQIFELMKKDRDFLPSKDDVKKKVTAVFHNSKEPDLRKK